MSATPTTRATRFGAHELALETLDDAQREAWLREAPYTTLLEPRLRHHLERVLPRLGAQPSPVRRELAARAVLGRCLGLSLLASQQPDSRQPTLGVALTRSGSFSLAYTDGRWEHVALDGTRRHGCWPSTCRTSAHLLAVHGDEALAGAAPRLARRFVVPGWPPGTLWDALALDWLALSVQPARPSTAGDCARRDALEVSLLAGVLALQRARARQGAPCVELAEVAWLRCTSGAGFGVRWRGEQRMLVDASSGEVVARELDVAGQRVVSGAPVLLVDRAARGRSTLCVVRAFECDAAAHM